MLCIKRWTSRPYSHNASGYLLPVVIALGMGISTVSVMALQSVAQNSSTLNTQQYRQLAREAAKAGITVATKCIEKDPSAALWSGTLQNTSCVGGGTAAPVISYASTGDVFQTTYGVSSVGHDSMGPGTLTLTSTGTVTIKGPGGQPVSNVTEIVRGFAKLAPGAPVAGPAASISAGTATACSTTSDNWVYCWGNDSYVLGNGSSLANNRSTTPLRVAGGEMANKRVTKVSVGATHACAIAREVNGSRPRAYCWGMNNYGQLGDRSNTNSYSPRAVDEGPASTQVIPGYCGGFWFGSSCIGWVNEQTITTPASSLLGRDIIDISAGNGFTCALTNTGKVSCWGRNNEGQLGSGNTSDRNYPAEVSTTSPSALSGSTTVTKLAQVKGTGATMCALTNASRPVCWGQNQSGGAGVAPSSATTTHRAEYTIRDKNRCDDAEEEAEEDAMEEAENAEIPNSSTRLLVPTNVATSRTFEGLTVINTRVSGRSLSNQNMYTWSGDYDVSYRITTRQCYRNSDTNGGDYARATIVVTRTITASFSTNSLSFDRQVGSIYSGNPINNVFCATDAGDVYCERNGSLPREGQLGNGVNYACSGSCPSIPTASQLVSRTLMKGAIQAMDTGTSGFTCAIAGGFPFCWGVNSSGQLGIGSTISQNIPTEAVLPGSSGSGAGAPNGPPRDWIYF